MTLIRDPAELRNRLTAEREAGRSIGLVPTMGALHEGHLSLIRAAAAENDLAVVSIFVNPKQFGPDEDFAAYPRDQDRDRKLARDAGADLVYVPDTDHVYPPGFSTIVEVTGLTDVLCGAPTSRGSAHFRGVTTVVCKLLNAVAPDRAYFGQKDAQQVAVIKRMVRDLEMPVEIRAMPIVREADGLAMSSRNVYLDPAERQLAASLSRALAAAGGGLAQGLGLVGALARAEALLSESGIEAEYLEARDPDSLEPVSELTNRPVLIALAAQVGPARLIDNLIFDPSIQSTHSTPVKSPAPQGGLHR